MLIDVLLIHSNDFQILEELQNMRKAHGQLVDDIKLNNEDFAKFVESTGCLIEDSISNKLRNDIMKIFNVSFFTTLWPLRSLSTCETTFFHSADLRSCVSVFCPVPC